MRKNRRPHRKGPGYSKHAFGELTDLNPRRIDKMIELGELKMMSLGGVEFIPKSELDRVLRLIEAEPEQQAAE